MTLARWLVSKVTHPPEPRPVALATWVRDWPPLASVPAGAVRIGPDAFAVRAELPVARPPIADGHWRQPVSGDQK